MATNPTFDDNVCIAFMFVDSECNGPHDIRTGGDDGSAHADGVYGGEDGTDPVPYDRIKYMRELPCDEFDAKAYRTLFYKLQRKLDQVVCQRIKGSDGTILSGSLGFSMAGGDVAINLQASTFANDFLPSPIRSVTLTNENEWDEVVRVDIIAGVGIQGEYVPNSQTLSAGMRVYFDEGEGDGLELISGLINVQFEHHNDAEPDQRLGSDQTKVMPVVLTLAGNSSRTIRYYCEIQNRSQIPAPASANAVCNATIGILWSN